MAAPRDDILQARSLAAQCRYGEAIALDRSALAALEPADPLNLIARQDLATAANATLDYIAAEQEARAALAFLAAKGETGGPRWALVAQNLAVALSGQTRFAEARALYAAILPALAGGDRGTLLNAELAAAGFEVDAGQPSEGLAHLDRARGLAGDPSIPAPIRTQAWLRIAEADRRALRLPAGETALKAASDAAAGPRLAPPRIELVRSGLLLERGRLTEALAVATSLAERQTTDRCDPTLSIDIAQRLGSLRLLRREVPEAGAAFTSALGEIGRLSITHDPREIETIYGLAIVARMSGDFSRSGALFDRAAALAHARYGGPNEAEAQALVEKALMQNDAGQASDAVQTARRALALLAQPVDVHPLTLAYAHAAMGLSAKKAGDYPLARAELETALAAFARARGSSFDLAPGLTALGEIALTQRRLGEAEAFFNRALDVQNRSGAATTLALGVSYWRLSEVAEARGDRARALARSGDGIDVIRRRLAIGEARPWNDAQVEHVTGRAIISHDLALSTGDAAPGMLRKSPVIAGRVLEGVQLANATTTGAAIAQMANRLESGTPALDALLRQRNDLATEWRSIQDALLDSLSGDKDGTTASRRVDLARRQSEIASRIVEIDTGIVAADPRLDLLLKSRSVDIAAVQHALGEREAMVAIASDDKQTYVVVVRRSGVGTYRAAISRDMIAADIIQLRQALDPDRWVSELPPFDTALAYGLYQTVLAPAEPMLNDIDTLAFVPDGPFGSLPLGVLLTGPAAPIGSDDDYGKLPWLIRRFAVATYPSVSSIVALRSIRADVAGRQTMLGVGDPVFQRGASSGEPAKADLRSAVLRAMGSRLASTAVLQRLPALPDTRAELQAISHAIGDQHSRLLLGSAANEHAVRTVPLDSYGVIVFATHGLVAGDLVGYAEPALALSPPLTPSTDDDGLLAASEIAQLHLRADWVILSACNTAASDGSPKAEPLSGLAKSFFYAGARSLLVTNWSVESEATAKLTSQTVAIAAGGFTPAQALRAAMLAFIEDSDGSHKTHPFFWAPFSLIGG